jgi:hypothetical protein
MAKKAKTTPLEDGLLSAMKAIDNQIARRMQRSPDERDVGGVQKWEPHQEKIESVCSHILRSFGEDEVGLDAVLVLTQAYGKALYLIVEELGEDSLGDVRTAYCQAAFENLLRDIEQGMRSLSDNRRQLM